MGYLELQQTPTSETVKLRDSLGPHRFEFVSRSLDNAYQQAAGGPVIVDLTEATFISPDLVKELITRAQKYGKAKGNRTTLVVRKKDAKGEQSPVLAELEKRGMSDMKYVDVVFEDDESLEQ